MISSAAQYALRAAAYLAVGYRTEYVPVRAIAQELDLPRTFLAKIFKALVEADICTAYRGPTGGVRLSRPAGSISVREVLEAIDGPGLFTECILGLPGCGEQKPCPMHAGWAEIRGRLAERMTDQKLSALAEGYQSGAVRLKG